MLHIKFMHYSNDSQEVKIIVKMIEMMGMIYCYFILE